MDFTGWPTWLILAALLLTTLSNQHVLKFLNRVLSVFGIVRAKKSEIELEKERWDRNREDWFRDTIFDFIKTMFADFQKQSESRDKTLLEVMQILQRNTDATTKSAEANNQLANSVKLLAQKLINLEETVEEKLSLIETRWLGRSSAND